MYVLLFMITFGDDDEEEQQLPLNMESIYLRFMNKIKMSATKSITNTVRLSGLERDLSGTISLPVG